MAIQDEGEGEGGTLAGSVIPCICPGFFFTMVGKGVFLTRKETRARLGRIEVERGREFQMDGAANEKERRPFADRISGTVRRNLSRDLKFLVGI